MASARKVLACFSTLPSLILRTQYSLARQAAVTASGVGPKFPSASSPIETQAPALCHVIRRWCLSPARRRCARAAAVTDAISALVNLGYGPPQWRRPLSAGAARISGENAETAHLINSGEEWCE